MTRHHDDYSMKQRKEYIADLIADPCEEMLDSYTRKELTRSIVHDICPEHEYHERTVHLREPRPDHTLNFDD